MRRIILIFSFTSIIFSCSNKSHNDLEVFRATKEGLQRSNEIIQALNNILYSSLEERTKDPQTAERARIWQSKAARIREISSDITNYMEELIKQLQEEAGIKEESGKIKIQEDNIDASTRLFRTKEKGIELYEKLKKYKQDMLGIDPELDKAFGNNSIIITREFDLDSSEQKDLTKIFFENTTVVASLALLDKFENNVRIMEHKFVQFCHNQTSSPYHGFYVPNPIVALSTSCVKAGEKIEIYAGIGNFSTAANPVFIINNSLIQPNDDAVVTYKFKSPLKAGKYSVPVKIEYIDPNGLKQSMIKKVEYTVIE
jgi:hypothetical protein